MDVFALVRVLNKILLKIHSSTVTTKLYLQFNDNYASKQLFLFSALKAAINLLFDCSIRALFAIYRIVVCATCACELQPTTASLAQDAIEEEYCMYLVQRLAVQ